MPLHPVTLTDIADDAVAFMKRHNIRSVLDLGCGDGVFREKPQKELPDAAYSGIDIYEHPKMTNVDGFRLYNGVDIPAPASTLGFIYSKQVLEHVKDPYGLLRDVSRVLANDGFFLGSCSGLEPQHGCSIFNFTPYGLKHVFECSGLELLSIWPGVSEDGLMQYHRDLYMGENSAASQWGAKTPAMIELEQCLDGAGHAVEWVNYVKLLFAGHICFLARKEPGVNHA